MRMDVLGWVPAVLLAARLWGGPGDSEMTRGANRSHYLRTKHSWTVTSARSQPSPEHKLSCSLSACALAKGFLKPVLPPSPQHVLFLLEGVWVLERKGQQILSEPRSKQLGLGWQGQLKGLRAPGQSPVQPTSLEEHPFTPEPPEKVEGKGRCWDAW